MNKRISNPKRTRETRNFYNVICVELGILGDSIIYHSVNRGTINEVHEFVEEHVEEHPNAPWVVIPRQVTF